MMALIIGLASPLLALAAIWLGLVAAAAAVTLALASRRELKADPGLRGFGFSLAALLTGGGVLIVAGVPFLMSTSLVALVPN
jgi:hypothetical protein